MLPKNHIQFEYNQITAQIFIGTNMCCQTHFKKKLLAKGIEADISLEGERIDKPFGIKFFLWLPTADHLPPAFDQLAFGADAIANFIKMNKKIYIHCKNGHGRAPTLVSAYFIKHKNMSAKEAVEFIKQKRTEIHLEKPQIEALKKFMQKNR